MSVVIGAKYKDGIIIAADKQATMGNTKTDDATKLQAFKYSNSAIGVVGYLRDCNLMRTLEEVVPYKDILDNVPVDELYVIRAIVPAIFTHLSMNKRLTNNQEQYTMDSRMLYATSDSLFTIDGDFGVVEARASYEVIGCGDDKVRGFMTSIGDTSNMTRSEVLQILDTAIRKGCEKDVFIDDRIDVIVLEKHKGGF